MKLATLTLILLVMAINVNATESFEEVERRCHDEHWYAFIAQRIQATSIQHVAREIKSGRLELSGEWLTIVWRQVLAERSHPLNDLIGSQK